MVRVIDVDHRVVARKLLYTTYITTSWLGPCDGGKMRLLRILPVGSRSRVQVESEGKANRSRRHDVVTTARRKSSRGRNFRQAHTTPPAHNVSRDVIDHVTIRFAMCHFQLVVHCNLASISNRFRDIRPSTMLTN